MYVRFLFASLTAAAFFWTPSSFAYTPLNLRVSAPTLTETLQEYVGVAWDDDTSLYWVNTTYTRMTAKNIEFSVVDEEIERLSGGPSVPTQREQDLKEELETVTILGGMDFHLGEDFLIGVLFSYQTSDSTQTFGEYSIDTSLVELSFPAFTSKDTTESYGFGNYFGVRFDTFTLHTAYSIWFGHIPDERPGLELNVVDFFLSASLTQEWTVAGDILSLGWHLSGVRASRDYENGGYENRFTRGEVGFRIGLHLPKIEIFALANANYDTFSDAQSVIYDTSVITEDGDFRIFASEDRFSFAEEQFGVNIVGGAEIAFSDNLKLDLSGQYLDLFRESYEGYSGSVQLSLSF